MNTKSILIISLVFLCTLSACEKEKVPQVTPDPPSVLGYWEGKYGSGSEVPTSNFAMVFLPDGKLRVYADYAADTTTGGKAQGTYIVTDHKVKTTYSYPSGTSYSTIVDVNKEFTTMDGTWGLNAEVSGLGTFRLFKK